VGIVTALGEKLLVTETSGVLAVTDADAFAVSPEPVQAIA
jgi:hypothetical protein